jgi:hypothetical protein
MIERLDDGTAVWDCGLTQLSDRDFGLSGREDGVGALGHMGQLLG